MTLRAWDAVAGLAGAALVLLLLGPLVALVVATGPEALLAARSHPLVGPALALSLQTSLVSLALTVVLGTPLAWSLSRARGRPAALLETALQLPVVMPPAVAGVALLLAFGRRGLPGRLGFEDTSLAFTTAAVVLAQTFVSAPLYVQAALAAFRRLEPDLLAVARSLGASPARVFFGVALPLSAGALSAGAALSWARALGEFGATLMFAGNLGGVTQTLPLAIYTALESDPAVAQALSVGLMLFAFGLLLLLRRLAPNGAEGRR